MHPLRVIAGFALLSLAATALGASTFDEPFDVRREPRPIIFEDFGALDSLPAQTPAATRRSRYPWRGFSVSVFTGLYFLFPAASIGAEFSAPVLPKLSLYGRVEGSYGTFFGGALFETGARYYWDKGSDFAWYGGAGLKFAAGDFFIDRVFEDTKDRHIGVGGFGINTHGGLEIGPRRFRFFVQSEHGFLWFFGGRVSTVIPYFGASAGIRFFF